MKHRPRVPEQANEPAAESASSSEQTAKPSPHPRLPAEQAMIERAVGLLLPRAVCNIAIEKETPLRWFEGYMVGEGTPFNVAVWANLNPERTRTLSLTRTLSTPHRPNKRGVLWTCTLDEPVLQKSSYSSTKIEVFQDSTTTLDRAVYWQSHPEDKPGVCVDGEWNFALTPDRRQELLDHVGQVLTEAVTYLPISQASFLLAHDYDPEERSFTTLASEESKAVFEPLVAAVQKG